MRFTNISPAFKSRLRLVAFTVCVLSLFPGAVTAQSPIAPEPQYKELPRLYRVNDRLYRGAQPRKGGISRLADLGVKTIINLRDDDERAQAEEREARALGLKYFNIPFARLGRPTDEQVDRVLKLIEEPENGAVFVHCAHGQDRTGVIIAIYRISHEGWTSERAQQEANSIGMKFWQRSMKDYISDYYRDHVQHNPER